MSAQVLYWFAVLKANRIGGAPARWEHGRACSLNYVARMTIPADPLLIELLERATARALGGAARESGVFWSTVAQAAAAVPVDEVLASAVTFCRSDADALRATGAGMLAELCNLGGEWGAEVLGILVPLLDRETSLDVIRIALHGVGLTGLAEGIPPVLRFAAHADAGVRLDATHALYSCAGEPPSRAAIEALIVLSADPDEHVRDWATFGVGSQIDVDDGDVRAALVDRLSDTFLDAREEAAVGLARRRDPRAFETVRELLEADEVSPVTVEAAGYLADERLLRPLIELGEWWEDDPTLLRAAIDRSDPVARTRFEERLRSLVQLVERDFDERVPGGRLDELTARPSFLELASELIVSWRDAGGLRRDALWSVERLFARSDVNDDPERAAAAVLAALAPPA
jgi:HEAT repeat protein